MRRHAPGRYTGLLAALLLLARLVAVVAVLIATNPEPSAP